ncbi:hypothetical protein sphantq_00736 [Sphingobium sp. AntQ-1]|uniref:hypothetical protein n=1 Tax=Sphingobium sp. AntQ-1 TaxID=2930091 RepID=UPI00234F605E|nr:hypothetical protein [Sphingobium sp. AntQ-1]WCP12337.1 hypothetical protein sphantq_00736 [Sphingobium sp. AntQ-1]
MDKFIYVALGVGVLIIAAVDQSTSTGQATSPALVANTAAAQSPSSAINESGASYNADTSPRVTFSVLPPSNPIPRADALGGKVIDNRFQPDG